MQPQHGSQVTAPSGKHQRELGIAVSLGTVERAVAHLRREVLAQSTATFRFETPTGQQLQIDFGTERVPVAEESIKVHLFVATLGVLAPKLSAKTKRRAVLAKRGRTAAQ